MDRHPILAREGWAHCGLAIAAALTVQVVAGFAWAAFFWFLAIMVVQFFRDPSRTIPDDPLAVVCPADGRVIKVDEVEDPWLKRPARRISVFMNVFNVHSNRSPVAGRVEKRWYHAGRFLNAALDKAASENERSTLWIKTAQGDDVTVVQVAGLVARRILCYAEEGTVLARGQRYGFIRFGSRVDVYLPARAAVKVSLGDRVTAGRDILAFLPPA